MHLLLLQIPLLLPPKEPTMINLDCESNLRDVLKRTDLHPVQRRYATRAMKARAARIGGRILEAQRHEEVLEGLYGRLPKALRW